MRFIVPECSTMPYIATPRIGKVRISMIQGSLKEMFSRFA